MELLLIGGIGLIILFLIGKSEYPYNLSDNQDKDKLNQDKDKLNQDKDKLNQDKDKFVYPDKNKEQIVYPFNKTKKSWYKGFNGKARSRRKCYRSLKQALGIYKK